MGDAENIHPGMMTSSSYLKVSLDYIILLSESEIGLQQMLNEVQRLIGGNVQINSAPLGNKNLCFLLTPSGEIKSGLQDLIRVWH